VRENLKGKRYYPWEVIPRGGGGADLEAMLADGRAVPATGGGQAKPVGVWMTPEDYRGLKRQRRMEPRLAAAVAGQQARMGGCGKCGDEGLNGL
jgi:hypothetical protein